MIQAAAYRLLNCFIDTNERNFADLCTAAGYPTDLGGYYLRQLVRLGYVSHGERGVYAITPKGRTVMVNAKDRQIFTNRPRLVVLIVATYQEKYVVLRRNRQPFIGVAEWPAGAVTIGEPLEAAGQRLAKDRLGARIEPQLVGFFRRIDLYQDEPFDDKLFAIHSCYLKDRPELLIGAMGTLELYSAAELASINRPARSLIDVLEYVNQHSAPYAERIYHLAAADFEPNLAI
jgi:ADP-ribose pyrophosphatase YjhB (NUDIX family)/predicted transcriptional regulator